MPGGCVFGSWNCPRSVQFQFCVVSDRTPCTNDTSTCWPRPVRSRATSADMIATGSEECRTQARHRAVQEHGAVAEGRVLPLLSRARVHQCLVAGYILEP